MAKNRIRSYQELSVQLEGGGECENSIDFEEKEVFGAEGNGGL